MISRREKIKKQFNSARESVFYAALEVLTDKTLNMSAREVDKIVRTYRDLPAPYGHLVKKGKSTPVEVKAEKIASRRSSENKTEIPKSGIVENKVKIKTEELSQEQVLETPKSRRSRPKGSQHACAKTEPGTDKSMKTEKVEKSTGKDRKIKVQTSAKIDTDLESSVCDMSNSALDTSEIINVENEDDTLVNTSQASSTATNSTLVQSETESGVDKNDLSTTKVKQHKRPGRPVGSTKRAKQAKVDGVKEDSSQNSSGRKVRTRSSLPEIANEETADVNGNPEGADVKPYAEASDNRVLNLESKPKVTAEKRDRRHSSAVKLTESEKDELIQKFPSAKNVSDHVKAELNGYFKNNKLIVSNKVRQKVQSALLNGRRNRFGKGIVIDHSQKKIDSFFVKSPPPCDPDSPKSPAKNVSRVLNELSPTRDRYEANNIERTSSVRSSLKVSEFHLSRRSGNTPTRNSPILTNGDKSFEKSSALKAGESDTRTAYESVDVSSVRERLFDSDTRRATRSSRESTPDSTASSARSVSSYKRKRQETTRLRTRSSTPVSVSRDSDESESENICTESRRLRR